MILPVPECANCVNDGISGVQLPRIVGFSTGTLSKEVGDDFTYIDRKVVDYWSCWNVGRLVCLGLLYRKPRFR